VAPPRRLAAKLGHPLPGEEGFGSAVIERFRVSRCRIAAG
jgi:hypothetical protein